MEGGVHKNQKYFAPVPFSALFKPQNWVRGFFFSSVFLFLFFPLSRASPREEVNQGRQEKQQLQPRWGSPGPQYLIAPGSDWKQWLQNTPVTCTRCKRAVSVNQPLTGGFLSVKLTGPGRGWEWRAYCCLRGIRCNKFFVVFCSMWCITSLHDFNDE